MNLVGQYLWREMGTRRLRLGPSSQTEWLESGMLKGKVKRLFPDFKYECRKEERSGCLQSVRVQANTKTEAERWTTI